MTPKEILHHILNGTKIKKVKWPPQHYIKLCPTRGIILNQDNAPVRVIDFADWVLA